MDAVLGAALEGDAHARLVRRAAVDPPALAAVDEEQAAEEAAGEWCARYPDVVTRSAYIGRYGWIKVPLDGAVPDDEVRELVDTSYADVVARLPKKRRPASA